MPSAFISFRNGDEPFAAAVIFRELGQVLGRESVFRSTNSLQPGTKWAPEIWQALVESRVVVVVIGPRWLTLADEFGRPRIAQKHDWVRREVAHALASDKHVVPVLVNGAPRLRRQDLPRSLVRLAERQSVRLDHGDIEGGMDALVATVVRAIPVAQAPSPASGGRVADPGWPATWRMPARADTMVERDREIQDVAELIRSRDGRAVVVAGGVGVGKTQLAVELTYRYLGEYDHVWWISARSASMAADLTALARRVGVEVESDVREVVPAIVAAARRRGQILFVIDGLDDPDGLEPLLPAIEAGARVLITSRNHDWGLLPVVEYRLARLTRRQSVALVNALLSTPRDADRLAEALDDLPLALSQAATFITTTDISIEEYIDLLRARTRDVLARGDTHLYPGSLGAAWTVALTMLRQQAPAAVALLELLAFVAPAPFPIRLLTQKASTLAPMFADVLTIADAVTAVSRSGLVAVADGCLHPHALLQAFVAADIDPNTARELRRLVRDLLSSVDRSDPRAGDPDGNYAALWPHARAVDIVESTEPAGLRLVLDLAKHLISVADPQAALALTLDAAQRWGESLGADNSATLDAMAHAAQALYFLRRYHEAAAVDRKILARLRSSLGEDHPQTLTAAHNLAIDMWAAKVRTELPGSAELVEVLRRRQHVLGPSDPDTLRSAHNVGVALRAAGSFAEARDLDETTLAALRVVLGADHADTLRSAFALGLDLIGLGETALAVTVLDETDTRLRRVLGPSHPDTLRAGYALAVALRACDDPRCLEVVRDVYRRYQDRLGDGHVDTLRAALLYGQTLGKYGGVDAAAEATQVVRQAGTAIAALGQRAT